MRHDVRRRRRGWVREGAVCEWGKSKVRGVGRRKGEGMREVRKEWMEDEGGW